MSVYVGKADQRFSKSNTTIAARGLCRFGHPNTPENTQRIGKAGVRCKECRRRIARESARRAREMKKNGASPVASRGGG